MFSYPPVDLTGIARLTDLPPTAFVSNASMPVADLLANYPAGPSFLGKYARVTDLYGAADEVMRCSSNGATYYWRPQRADYAVSMTNTGGAVALTPLVTPPQIFMTSGITSNMTITPSSTNAWPGAQFSVTVVGLIQALISVNIAGLVGSSVPLLTGTTKILTYTAAGWRSE